MKFIIFRTSDKSWYAAIKPYSKHLEPPVEKAELTDVKVWPINYYFGKHYDSGKNEDAVMWTIDINSIDEIQAIAEEYKTKDR